MSSPSVIFEAAFGEGIRLRFWEATPFLVAVQLYNIMAFLSIYLQDRFPPGVSEGLAVASGNGVLHKLQGRLIPLIPQAYGYYF